MDSLADSESTTPPSICMVIIKNTRIATMTTVPTYRLPSDVICRNASVVYRCFGDTATFRRLEKYISSFPCDNARIGVIFAAFAVNTNSRIPVPTKITAIQKKLCAHAIRVVITTAIIGWNIVPKDFISQTEPASPAAMPTISAAIYCNTSISLSCPCVIPTAFKMPILT